MAIFSKVLREAGDQVQNSNPRESLNHPNHVVLGIVACQQATVLDGRSMDWRRKNRSLPVDKGPAPLRSPLEREYPSQRLHLTAKGTNASRHAVLAHHEPSFANAVHYTTDRVPNSIARCSIYLSGESVPPPIQSHSTQSTASSPCAFPMRKLYDGCCRTCPACGASSCQLSL
jgi:hypothetical protein